MSSTKKII